MGDLLEKLFDTTRYTSAVDKDRARLVYGITTLLLVIFTLVGFFIRNAQTNENVWQQMATNPSILFTVVSLYALAVPAILLTRRGRIDLSSGLVIVLFFVSLSIPTTLSGLYTAIGGVIVVLVIFLAGLLLSNRGVAIGTVLALFLVLLGISRRAVAAPPTAFNNVSDLISLLAGVAVFAGLTYLFRRYARLIRAEAAAQATFERQAAANILTHISRQVTRRTRLADFLDDVVTQIVQAYPEIYHAQVFLIDEVGQAARLVASTGTAGKDLITRQHRLEVGSLSVIGQATLQGHPVIAQAGAPGSIHRPNPALPHTAVEAAFPLRIGDVIIGALDFQSQRATAFQPLLVEALSGLSDGLALAIDNVQQFERAEARIEENQELVEQARNALHEVERLNERLTGRAWSEYLRGRSDYLSLQMDFAQNVMEHEVPETQLMLEAIKSGYLVQDQVDDKQLITVPLRVRGQVVGAMEFELDQTQPFLPEDLNLLQEISERFGLAAENTRLVEESQQAAQREALVNEISSRLQAANNVETTLSEAVRSLRDAVKAGQVRIRLGTPPAPIRE